MEPFIPIAVMQSLDALGNLALILVTPAMIYLTLKLVRMDVILSHHIVYDKEMFKELNDHVEKHYSSIHDLELDVRELHTHRVKLEKNVE